MPYANPTHIDLQAIAKQIMIERGFRPDFPPEVQKQLAALRNRPPKMAAEGGVRDLRNLLWSSIDNDTSRDLDQIEVAERLPDGGIRVLVGIADVDAFVPKHSPIDEHAARETTTVYTGMRNFPMLPEELSTDASSLLEDGDKLGIVIEFVAGTDGGVHFSDVYRAIVRNRAQLAYGAVGAWLEAKAIAPAKVSASIELQAQLKLQDEAAQALRKQRYREGALNLETSEVRPIVLNPELLTYLRKRWRRILQNS